MISTGELKKGVIIEMDNQLFSIMEYQHQKIGRGSAQVRMKRQEHPHRLDLGHHGPGRDEVPARAPGTARDAVPLRRGQHLLLHGSGELRPDRPDRRPAWRHRQLPEGRHGHSGPFYESEPVDVEPPINVELQIVETDPGFRGDTASGGTKPAKLETGLVVQVPLFVNQGETIRVDTRTGTYLERV